MSRATCFSLQYQLNAPPGVKVRTIRDNIPEQTIASNTDDIVVGSHVPQRDDWQELKNKSASQINTCEDMYIPVQNMDCERYQDLSQVDLYAPVATTWEAAEGTAGKMANRHSGHEPYDTSYTSLEFEDIDYSVGDMSNQVYNMTRTDSMEEMKNLPVTAPMEVVPMRHHEAIQVSAIVKTEQEDFDLGREEEVEDIEGLRGSPATELKMDPDFLKAESEMLLLDSPDLFSELQSNDLIDFILRDSPCDAASSPSTLNTPPHQVLNTPPRQLFSPPRALGFSRSPPTSLNIFPSDAKSSSSSYKEKSVKETYLAIPRELTGGIGEDKKIPKMLILKTPQTTTLSPELQNVMSIAERIKTVGKRQRTKKYSEPSEEESDGIEDEYIQPRKRTRRLSTSSCSTASGLDKYRELRDKNNEASRKSRQNRKEKERDLIHSLSDAEQENRELRAKSDELEKLVLSLRKLLLQIVVSKGSQR